MNTHGLHHQLLSRLGIEPGEDAVLQAAEAIQGLSAKCNSCAIPATEIADLLVCLSAASLDVRSCEPIFDWKLRMVVLHPNGVGVDLQFFYNQSGTVSRAVPTSTAVRLDDALSELLAEGLDAFKQGRTGRLKKGHPFERRPEAEDPCPPEALSHLKSLLELCRSLATGSNQIELLNQQLETTDQYIASIHGVDRLNDIEPGACSKPFGGGSSVGSLTGQEGENQIFDYLTRRMRKKHPSAIEEDLPIGFVFRVEGKVVGEIYWPDRDWAGEQQRVSIGGFDLLEWGIEGSQDDIRLHEVKATRSKSQPSMLRNRITSRQRCLALAVGPRHYEIWDVHDIDGERGGTFQSIKWTDEMMRKYL